jgi:DNA polymerase-3 subunit alpha/error-prone DNA polymerase
MVAVINNQGGFYRQKSMCMRPKCPVVLSTPLCQQSECETTVYGVDVYLGFMQLEGLDSKTAHRIVADNTNGEYQSLENFINRIPIGIEGIQILIFIGAFRFTTKTKNQLLVIARLILVNYKPENRNLMLLQEPVKEYKLPVLERSPLKMPSTKSNYSFPVSCTPFDLLQTKYRGTVLQRFIASS